jgi:hypothetical protein
MPEVRTVGRVSVDLYPEQIGVPLAEWEHALSAIRSAEVIKVVLALRPRKAGERLARAGTLA